MYIQLAFAYCARTDWDSARSVLAKINEDVEGQKVPPTDSLRSSILYLQGVICQGTGDIENALSTFQDPIFAFLTPTNTHRPPHSVQQDFSILAQLNVVLLLRHPSRSTDESISSILSSIEPLCLNHPNLDLRSAYSLIKAAAHPTDPMIKKKGYLQNALSGAQTAGNLQLTCLALNILSWKFFRGVVGEQAEKSAKAALALACKAEDRLWMCVAQEMMADTLEVQGKGAEAAGMRQKAGTLAEEVILPLRDGEKQRKESTMEHRSF